MLLQYKSTIKILIAILFLYASFLTGRLGYIYELYRSKPPIEAIPDINCGENQANLAL